MQNFFLFIFLLFCIVPVQAVDFTGKKVLHINSYHAGYAWSDGIEEGVKAILLPEKINLKFHRMDTNRNNSPDFMAAAGLKAKAEIEAFQPDIVIVADDNAVEHVLMKYYRNAKLPFVFCGVNWDASVYRLPYRNTTGMLEVGLELGAIERLKDYAKGNRIGFLGTDSTTDRKSYLYHTEMLGIHYHKAYFSSNFEAWKTDFLDAQQNTDLLIMPELSSIDGWNAQEAEQLVLNNTRIPAAATQEEIAKFALFGIVKVPKEQGIWAARAALDILAGAIPDSIPMTKNKLHRLILNQRLADRLGIQLSKTLGAGVPLENR